MNLPKNPANEDWLLAQYEGKATKDACILAMNTVLHIARDCCDPPLSLGETKELMEMVWYEMDEENKEPILLQPLS